MLIYISVFLLSIPFYLISLRFGYIRRICYYYVAEVTHQPLHKLITTLAYRRYFFRICYACSFLLIYELIAIVYSTVSLALVGT